MYLESVYNIANNSLTAIIVYRYNIFYIAIFVSYLFLYISMWWSFNKFSLCFVVSTASIQEYIWRCKPKITPTQEVNIVKSRNFI